MPIRYRIFPDETLNVAQHIGGTDMADRVAYFKATSADPDFVPDLNVLVDLSRIEGSSIKSEDLQKFSGMIGQRRENAGTSKYGFLAPDSYSYGVARMYLGHAASADNIETRICATAAELVEWLGLQHAPAHYLDHDKWTDVTP